MTGQLITLPVRLYVRGARVLVHAAEDVTGKAVTSTLRLAGLLGAIRPGSRDAEPSGPPPTPAPPQRSGSAGPPGSDAARGAPARPRPKRQGTTGRRNGSAAPRPRTGPPQPGPASTPPADLPEPDPRIASQAPEAAGAAEPARPPAPPPPPPAPATSAQASPPLAGERLEQEGVAAPVDLETPTAVAPDHVSAEPVLVREEAETGAEDGAGASITVQEPWNGYAKLNARDIVARLASSSTAELAAVQLFESAHRKRPTVITAVTRELAKPQR